MLPPALVGDLDAQSALVVVPSEPDTSGYPFSIATRRAIVVVGGAHSTGLPVIAGSVKNGTGA
jgi:hypothetical protein